MSGSVSIRHIREEDVPEVKQLFAEVREQRKKYEIGVAFQHFLKHPYPAFLALVFMPIIYILSAASFFQCLIQATVLAIVIACTRFLWFGKTLLGVWRPKDEDTLGYYSLPGRSFLVAKIDGALVGTVCIVNTKDKFAGELHRMFINSNYRRKGIASRLMDKCKEEAKNLGYTSIVLMTTATNYNAIHFYEKAGFILSGRSTTIEMYPHTFGVVHYYLKLEDQK